MLAQGYMYHDTWSPRPVEGLNMDWTLLRQSLKTTPDKQMRKFLEHFKVQERKFNDIQLKGRVKGVKEEN